MFNYSPKTRGLFFMPTSDTEKAAPSSHFVRMREGTSRQTANSNKEGPIK